MTQIREQIHEQINDILNKNEDAIKGFEMASEKATKPAIINYFKEKAKNRKQFNNEIIDEMNTSYSDFEYEGSTAGTIHRTWMNVKSFFSGDSNEAMLEEAIRGDKAAVEEYKEAIDSLEISMTLKTLLLNQVKQIQMDIKQSEAFEENEY